MGRRKLFIPPLLSNRPSDVSLARLSAVAARHREELVTEVEEIGGNVPPTLPTASISIPTVPTSTMVMQRLLNSQEGGQSSKKRKSSHAVMPLFRSPYSQEGGQSSKKRKSPHVVMPLFRSPLSRMLLSPRIRSPSVQHETSPLASTTHTSYQSQRVMGDLDLNVEPEQDSQGEQRAMAERNVEKVQRVGVFRSPLSRMVLSPWMHPRVRSPSSGQGASSSADWNANEAAPPNEENADWNANAEEQLNLIDNEVAPPNRENARRKEVPNDTRKAIVEFLLAKSNNGVLKGHETREASTKFSVHIRTVQRIWNGGKRCLDQGAEVDVSSKKWKRGRKKKEVDISKLRELSISSRTTLRDLSKGLKVSRTKLHKMKQEGAIERVSNSLKPFLTEKNKKERLKWCVSMLDPRSVPHDPVFKGLFDFVVIDEKWFNITRRTERYYKAPDEEQPVRTCKNKNFIPKIMILCALARPRFDPQGNCTFDGKIGCFPFVTYEAAKRSSKNRRAGVIEMKPMDSIKQGVCREFLIEKVLPAIRAKWPQEDKDKTIYIQQDNAPSHVVPNDKLFCEAAKVDGFDMRLVLQPPNSPDLNVLDLGFFNSIQSIQYKTSSKTTEELVAAVDKAFDDYPPSKLNRIFLSLQGCMKEVMKIGGGNNYKLPHIRKEMLERQGHLPIQLSCDAALVDEANAQLNE